MARQRERLATITEEKTEPAVTRRGVLTTGGILTLLGLGSGTASAGTGQIGTSGSPLDKLYTDELNGGVTGGTALTSLTGSGLTINSGSLEASGGSSTSELVTSGNGNTALEVFDGGTQVADAGSSIDPPNVIGGHPNNNTGASSPKGVTIFGGTGFVSKARNKATEDWATISGGVEHDVTGAGAVVSGGLDNEVSGNYGTIGGGRNNTVSGEDSVIAGGTFNNASGTSSTVSGGNNNTASGRYSAVPGGGDGAAENDDSFVWNDGTAYHSIPNASDGLSSSTAVNGEPVTGSNTFSVSATSGFRFITGSASSPNVTYIDSSGNLVSAGNVDLDGNKLTNTQSINGGVTGNTEITDLVGSGLTINSGSLETSGGSTSELVTSTSGDTAFQVVDGTTDVSNAGSGIDAPNVVGGHPDNNTGGNSPKGVFIAGGSGSGHNVANANHATVSGGISNKISAQEATVGGGHSNRATGEHATVSGGLDNRASGTESTVGGGESNTAGGKHSTVPGGLNGAATNDNSFVWNDGTAYHDIPNEDADGLDSFISVDGSGVTGANTFSVSATGGVRFITGSSSVTYIDGGSTGWSTTSARSAKTNIDPVDPERILDGVAEMEVATWEYQDDDGAGQGVTHIGPMAGEFHDVVDVGVSDDHINSINADGVAFAAIQGLSQKLDTKDGRIDALEADLDAKDARIDDQQDRIDALEAENDALREENDRLRERIAAIEAELGIDATADQQGVADD